MERTEKLMLRMNRKKFGLLGRNISYSFSAKYFKNKFEKLGLEGFTFENFDLPELFEFPFILYQRKDEFSGFSVTIPYKEAIKRYLDNMDDEAAEIGAINCIKVEDDNSLTGYNTDVHGFVEVLKPLLKEHHKSALILGTGGASKAIAYGLKKLGLKYRFVSRSLGENQLLYSQLNKDHLNEFTVIVNCTPVGTFPNVADAPNIPYEYITDKHILFDLIYNPEITAFLQKGIDAGATVKNGFEMLELQAEKSWEIWNSL